jgi:hypothetical protein
MGQGELTGRTRGPAKKLHGSGLPRPNGPTPGRCSLHPGAAPPPPLLSSSPALELILLSRVLLALLSSALCSPLVFALRSSSLSACISRIRATWRRPEECVEALLWWARARRVDLVVHVGHCEGEAASLREERSLARLRIWREIPRHGVRRSPAHYTSSALALTSRFGRGCFFLPPLKVSCG